jgi:sugar fermentation stimulation protein A
VTTRGLKHLRELMEMRASGHRAVLLFCVQHQGIEEVRPADEIDPAYGAMLREAQGKGVEVMAYRADISEQEIRLATEVPVRL